MSANLEHVRVRDCMHAGILGCTPDTPAREVAAMMAAHRVHAVAVQDHESDRPIGIVSDLDIVAAADSNGAQLTAVEVAATEPLAISGDDTVRHAAQVMAEHGVAHLLVRDGASGYPVGIVSTLDIAAVYAD